MSNNGQYNTLTQRQRRYGLLLFDGMEQREAYLKAGYSSKSALSTIDAHASRLASNGKVKAFLQELWDKAESAKVMSVQERLERLSEIARARLTDFMTAGADGSWIDIGPENPNAAALQEITSRTEYDSDSAKAAVITKIKLLSPLQAIDLLNKMEKLYADGSPVNIEKAVIVFQDMAEETKKRLEELTSG